MEELNTTISELEDLRAVSEELEESQTQMIKDLRSDIRKYSTTITWNRQILKSNCTDKKEMEMLNREGELANLQLKCSDQEKTISQFRDLVNKLQVIAKITFKQ